MWYSKPFRSVNIQRGVRESCCLRSGQLEHLSKINYPTQAIVQTKSPRIFELILCLIFSTTTGWSYPSASRATRPQQSCLLHKTGSSWLFLGGSQTIHPTQISPFLRRLCWDLWVPATGKAAPSWRRWAADGIPNDSAARKRNRCTYWQLPKRALEPNLKYWEFKRKTGSYIDVGDLCDSTEPCVFALLHKAESDRFRPTNEVQLSPPALCNERGHSDW